MCGIAAISLSPGSHIPVGKLTHYLLKELEPRGTDASGFGFQQPGRTYFHKKDVPGRHLDVTSIPRGVRSVIIHTRNSTKGSPSVMANNHPVVSPEGTIALVHNGVISNDMPIRDSFTHNLPEVDSAVLPAMIERDGWRTAMLHASGWAAVAWLDSADYNAIHLVRRDRSSPMIVGQFRDGSMVMASTERSIEEAVTAIGFYDELESLWEVPQETYIRVRRGRIESLQDSPGYLASKSPYKTAYQSPADQARLARVTSGEASSSFSPSTTTPTKSGGATGTVGSEALSYKCPFCAIWAAHKTRAVHIMTQHKDEVFQGTSGRWCFQFEGSTVQQPLDLEGTHGWWSTPSTSKEVVRAPKGLPRWDEPSPNGEAPAEDSTPMVLADEGDLYPFTDEAIDVWQNATWWLCRKSGGSPILRHFPKYDQYLILKRAAIEEGALTGCGFLSGPAATPSYHETTTEDNPLSEVGQLLDHFMVVPQGG